MAPTQPPSRAESEGTSPCLLPPPLCTEVGVAHSRGYSGRQRVGLPFGSSRQTLTSCLNRPRGECLGPLTVQTLCDTGQVSEPLWALKQKLRLSPTNLNICVRVQGLEGQCCSEKVTRPPGALWVEELKAAVLLVEGPRAAV